MSSQTRSPLAALLHGRAFAPFKRQGFTPLWSARLLSNMNFTLERIVQGWIVLELTDDPFWVGAVWGVRGLGSFIMGLPAGLLADRFDRRIVVAMSNMLSASIAATLAALALTGNLSVWHMAVASFLFGVVNSSSGPSNNTMVFDTVGPALLMNASAINFLGGTLSGFMGGIIGGPVLERFGAGAVYSIMAVAWACSPIGLLWVKVGRPVVRSRESPLTSLRHGVAYGASNDRIRPLLLTSIVIELFGFSYQTLVPVLARDYLGLGPSGFGFLQAAGSVGSFIGSMTVASLGDVRSKGRLVVGLATLFGLGIVLFAIAPWLWLTVVLMASAQAFALSYDITMTTIFQQVSTAEMRGRVVSMQLMTYSFTPIGGVQAGFVAATLGAPAALLIGGVITMAAALRLIPMAKRWNNLAQAAVATPQPDPQPTPKAVP